MKLAKCCDPVYGDEVVGYITRNRGIIVHRKDCENIQKLGYDCDRLVEVEWGDTKESKLPVELKILTFNKMGVLADITNTALKLYINVKDINTDESEEKAVIYLKIEVKNKSEVDKFMEALNAKENIIEVKRGKKTK